MKNSKKTIKIISVLLILTSLLIISNSYSALAQNLTNSKENLKIIGEGGKIGTVPIEGIGYKAYIEGDLTTIVSQIIRLALSLLGIIFLVLIILGGYQWMTAGGNEEIVTKARQRMTNAAIGLAIVLLAYAISYFIIYYITIQTINTT